MDEIASARRDGGMDDVELHRQHAEEAFQRSLETVFVADLTLL